MKNYIFLIAYFLLTGCEVKVATPKYCESVFKFTVCFMNEYKEPLNASTNEMKRQFNVAYDECIGKGFSYSKEALERITEFKNYNNHVITERCIESVRYVRHKGRFENKPIYACVWKEELTGISCLKEAESL